MAGYQLRPARDADMAAVGRIWSDGWRDGHLGHVAESLVALRTPESFLERAAGRAADTTVAVTGGEVTGGEVTGGEVTGFVMVTGAEAEQVYVAAEHRGSGVAALLLAEAERRIADAGHPTAWLAVAPGNARARRFYERMGWVDEGEFDYPAAGPDGPIPVPCHRYTKPV